MLESVLLSAFLISAPAPAPTFLYEDESAESAAAVATAVRFEPASGRATIATRGSDGTWSRARHELAPAAGRSRFSLEFEPGAGRLLWSADGHPLVETLVPTAVALDGPNLLRLELANFDRAANAAVERLEIELDEGRRELRSMGSRAMTRDLVTLSGPALARGFRLSGELVLRGAPIAPNRVFIDFGLGRGRRVEVGIEGEGGVASVPSRVARAPRRKSAVGYFAPEEDALLRAVGEGFREWETGGVAFAGREIELARGTGDSTWTARFDAATEDLGSAAGPEGTNSFSNSAAILVPFGQPATTTGTASPYPSTIEVTGPVKGPLMDLTLSLKDVTHTYPDDLDALVVSPHGTDVLFLSDACGLSDVAAVDWTFDDDLPTPLTDSGPCGSGSFDISLYDGVTDPFNAPAPASPYSTDFNAFSNENVNGMWSLYVFDDGASDVGSIAGGWELAFATWPATIAIPGTGTSGPASPYPQTRTIAPTDPVVFGTIVDVDLVVNQLWHQFPDDIDFLLVAPNGDNVLLMSDACGSGELEGITWTFDDEGAAPLSDEDASGCTNGLHVRPTNYEGAESLPGPAPAEPYGSALSVFDGDDPVGTWEYYIRDEAAFDVGFITNIPTLQIKTTGIFRNGFDGGQNNCLWDWNPDVLGCDK